MRKRFLFILASALLFAGSGCGQVDLQQQTQVNSGLKTKSADNEAASIEATVEAEDAVNAGADQDAKDLVSDQQEINVYGSTDYGVK